jgi:hypothetical protein
MKLDRKQLPQIPNLLCVLIPHSQHRTNNFELVTGLAVRLPARPQLKTKHFHVPYSTSPLTRLSSTFPPSALKILTKPVVGRNQVSGTIYITTNVASLND